MEENRLNIIMDLIETHSNRLDKLEDTIHQFKIERGILTVLQGTFYIFGILALAAIIGWLFTGIPVDLHLI